MGGTMVELLEDRAEIDQFFADYPDSVVLINNIAVADIFAGDEAIGQLRTLRTLLVGRTNYAVVCGPAATSGHFCDFGRYRRGINDSSESDCELR
jgi:hypothetical protein